MRALLVIAAALAIASLASGCDINPPGYKYKLTLAVNRPDGIKSASNVVEISFNKVIITGSGLMAHATGEALYLDFGPGRRPLIALLTKKYQEHMPFAHWDEIQPTTILAKVYGENDVNNDDWLTRISRHRGAMEIAPSDLPDLVTFTDINDPKRVMLVDPDNLEATLGPGVKWKSITLEITDEPLTSGIENRLGWLVGLETALDGTTLHYASGPKASLANSLTATNFIRRGY